MKSVFFSIRLEKKRTSITTARHSITTDKILLTTRSFLTIFIKTMWRNSCQDDDDDHNNNNNNYYYYYSNNKKIHTK